MHPASDIKSATSRSDTAARYRDYETSADTKSQNKGQHQPRGQNAAAGWVTRSPGCPGFPSITPAAAAHPALNGADGAPGQPEHQAQTCSRFKGWGKSRAVGLELFYLLEKIPFRFSQAWLSSLLSGAKQSASQLQFPSSNLPSSAKHEPLHTEMETRRGTGILGGLWLPQDPPTTAREEFGGAAGASSAAGERKREGKGSANADLKHNPDSPHAVHTLHTRFGPDTSASPPINRRCFSRPEGKATPRAPCDGTRPGSVHLKVYSFYQISFQRIFHCTHMNKLLNSNFILVIQILQTGSAKY